MAEINYKQKYFQLKERFMSSVDTAFRLGIEQGMQQAQQQQMEQQAQEQAALEQAAAAGQNQPGQPGQDGEAPGQPGEGAPGEDQPPASAHPEGSELDQHINQLESMLGKSEAGSDLHKELKKSLDGLKVFVNERKLMADIARGNAAIKTIAKNLSEKSYLPKPVRKPSAQAEANLPAAAKAALKMQQSIVDSVMADMEKEESAGKNAILSAISAEGASKKE